MKKERIKVYIYTRVSTAMQIDGYSLDAQKSRMKAFADFNDYEIVGEYEDAGKSGKSIEGRIQFNQMMEDIKSGKDGVSYVLVFKLSRFGRNAADVLSTLQVMQDFGVNLICVEDGIDSSKDSGKLMISVLSAVAEIERENIRTQTMAGREQKAREGKWNGGFAPYGYRLEKGELLIAEDEVDVIRTIFDRYIHTNDGVSGVAKYLNRQGFVKKLRQNFAWQYPAAALAQVPAKVSVTSIVHKAEQTTLERPGFLAKDGLTAAEMGALQPEVAQEPAMALEAGEDGLVFYRAIAEHYQKALRPGGALALEIGWQQREAVTALLAANGWTDIACRKDFGGNDRCVMARKQ